MAATAITKVEWNRRNFWRIEGFVTTETLHTDLYAVLGVAADASAEEISRAYRSLARAHHPDLHPDDPDAEDRFKAISAAYDLLGDPAKRAEYDRLQQQLSVGGAAGWAEVDDERLADLLGHLFGGSGRFAGPGGFGGGYGGGRTGRARGADLGGTVQVSLRDAVLGSTVTLTTPLGDDVEVTIAPGVDHGDRLLIEGAGMPGPDGTAPGDLLLTVVVSPDPVFERIGTDLVVEVSVDFPTLVLGGVATVPTVDGGSARIRIPEGTSPGRTFRLRHQGVPGRRGRGDLLARVGVDVPRDLTPEQRAAVEALRSASTT